MSKEDFLKIQTCTLKVSIHCDGCNRKVKKILHGIEGVYTTNIDAEQGKVMVSGSADPVIIIKKLNKAGKHAELWGSKNGAQNLPNQLQQLQLYSKSKNNNNNGGKPVKGGGGGGNDKGNPQQQKVQQLNPQQQQDLLQQIKGFQDMNISQIKDFKLPFQNEPKSVKFNLPPEDSDDGGDFDDGLDDYDDDEDFDDIEGFDDDFDEPIKKQPISLPPPFGGNDKKGNNKSNGGGKKGGERVDTPVQNKGDNNNDSKNGGKKGGSSNQGGGKNGGNSSNNQQQKDGGNGNGSNHQAPNPAMMMDLAQMANMMNHPHIGKIPGGAVQGLPAGGPPPGYFQGMPSLGMPSSVNPLQQQQYMAALMQQQRMMNGGVGGGGDGTYGHHPYHQPLGFAPPPPAADPYTHYFSDENANSCSIM